MESDPLEFRWYLTVMRRWLWLIVGCTLLGTISALIVTAQMPPAYNASATLLINAAPSDVANDYNAIFASERLVLTYSQILGGRPVMEAVITQLGLTETPDALAEKVTVMPVKDTQLIRLSVEQADPAKAALIANSIAETFISQIEALREVGSQGNVRLAIIETARVPEKPVERRALYVTLVGLVSVMLGVGIAFFAENFNDTIKTPHDVRRVLELNMLGAIGQLGKREKELVVLAQPTSVVAETFRMLCTKLRFSNVSKPLRIVLVTSLGSTEGKSFIVANLAIAMAQAGLRVVAVDADLRRSRLHLLFGLGLNGDVSIRKMWWGLTGVLLKGHIDNSDLCSGPADGLKILPSGELPPNPAELAGSEHMRKMLRALAEQADLVLLDSPPLLPVTDAMALAQAVDGVLLVVVPGHTQRQVARQAVESLRQVGANLVGVVFNAAPAHNGSILSLRGYQRKHRLRRQIRLQTAVHWLLQR
jgi:capsular exopolysaccharide synthesis family protein